MAIFKEQSESGPSLEDVIHGLDEIVPTREAANLLAHINPKRVNQGAAHGLTHHQSFLGALAIDGSLSLEEGVNPAHHFHRDGGHLALCVILAP